MRTRLPGDVYAPAAARRFVTTGLRGVLTSTQQTLSDDLALIVSELVTNSVRANARTIEVEVHVDDEAVEVRVTDDARGWPTVRVVDPESIEGRGLEIVGHLADSWRTVAQRGGKCVIATRRRRPE
jgi:anti-sigma regulatory factor (Ser/Thr protein kinase)